MKLLILGGTRFVGRHLVEAARARGDQVTLFHRGQTNPDLFPDVEKLHGDRDGGLEALAGRRWDAVIDTCGYVPRIVRASAEYLSGAVEHYTFISSISVYADGSIPNQDENAPLATLADETVEEVNGETYGGLKALCEQAAEAAMPGRVFTIRPGLIVGPHDPTDRFTYWPVRVARGGEVLAPGRPDRPVQVIDARDLAWWNLRMIDAGKVGVYNATGPAHTLTMAAMLDACRAAGPSDAAFTWVSEAFLLEHEVGPWMELPLWLPEANNGLMQADCSQAIGDGLAFRPLVDIARDTLAWHNTRPADYAWRAGLMPEKEAQVLDAWRARQSAG
ncbi:MAG: epimerase [Anaerolineae bacterium]|nr:epimerase [Anaerolineae bacterium]